MSEKKENVVYNDTRLKNIISLCTTKRLFIKRLDTEKRVKQIEAIKQMIILLDATLIDVRAGN